MKNLATNLFRGILLVFAAAMLAMYIFALPWFTFVPAEMIPQYMFSRYAILAGWYATAIPLYYALYQAFCLLRYVDRNTAISALSIKALRSIQRCGIATSVLLAIGLPYIYLLAQEEDAPGLMLMGMILASVPFVIAVLAAVLQKAFQQAIEIKSENGLAK